ncbi:MULTISPECIES: hypothetical protein [unclassified Mesorhizobium]|nr:MULTISPECIES: hypothetical protein [unclassified Mesorhizobium]
MEQLLVFEPPRTPLEDQDAPVSFGDACTVADERRVCGGVSEKHDRH